MKVSVQTLEGVNPPAMAGSYYLILYPESQMDIFKLGRLFVKLPNSPVKSDGGDILELRIKLSDLIDYMLSPTKQKT